MLIKIGTSYLADQIHANHPRQPFLAAKAKRKDADTSRQRGRSWTRYRPSGGQYCSRFCINRVRNDIAATLLRLEHERDAQPAQGHDTRAIQGWLGHRSITSTAVYTALAPNRFKDFWRD
jgi:hypothetical protein